MQKTMQVSISGIFNQPDYSFDLSGDYLDLLGDSIENLLQKSPLPNVKSEELELYICTDGKSEESSIRKISKDDKGQYLTFHFWIAYPKVVREVTEQLLIDVDLEIFTTEFIKCLELALTSYQLDNQIIEETKNKILAEINQDLGKYAFKFSEEESRRRITQRELLSKKIGELNAKYGRDVTKELVKI